MRVAMKPIRLPTIIPVSFLVSAGLGEEEVESLLWDGVVVCGFDPELARLEVTIPATLNQSQLDFFNLLHD